jgi:predicted lysophospholipase L1 biosynthesis ABC-type transport system permease subunit
MKSNTEDIKTIREMMEKSTKFMSLHGLSLVFAGIIACAGAAFANFCAFCNPSFTIQYGTFKHSIVRCSFVLLIDALVVLTLAVGVITYFCWRKAKKNHQSLFNSVTRRAAYNLLVPLAAGGIFSLVLLVRGDIAIVAASTLIFYGLALINASKFTFTEIHYLGICEVIIGLLAAIFPYHGILFWSIGFGILHIVFGIIIYIKYDKNNEL